LANIANVFITIFLRAINEEVNAGVNSNEEIGNLEKEKKPYKWRENELTFFSFKRRN